jgi:hypothetical protein
MVPLKVFPSRPHGMCATHAQHVKVALQTDYVALGGSTSVGVSTPWSGTNLSPWLLCSWQSAQLTEHFTFSRILYRSLPLATRPMLVVLDTDWARPSSA